MPYAELCCINFTEYIQYETQVVGPPSVYQSAQNILLEVKTHDSCTANRLASRVQGASKDSRDADAQSPQQAADTTPREVGTEPAREHAESNAASTAKGRPRRMKRDRRVRT